MSDQEVTGSVRVGQRLGKCQILEKLGEGGMGEVYLAEHIGLLKRVAVKILPPRSNNHKQIDRFLLEARMASRIEHPNVVTIHDVGWDAGLHYIVMRYVEGRNLADVLKLNGGSLPWPTALRIIRSAAKGLAAVHRQNLIHRDIKPSNIMLTNDGDVLLMDFGLVRSEEESDLTHTGTIVGTLRYMSPEQSRGDPLDRRSDIFSLGSTLYALLTGVAPFTGSEVQVCDALRQGARPRSPQLLVPTLPADVTAVVERAMAPRPIDRYADADEMSRDIGRLLRTAPKVGSGGTSSETTGMISEQLPELELIIDTADFGPSEADRARQAWQIGGIIVSILLVLGVVLNLSLGGGAPKPSIPSTVDLPDEMVLIPGGEVQLGATEAVVRPHLMKLGLEGEKLDTFAQFALEEPRERVKVPAFRMDAYEVTNEQYERFLAATNHAPPKHWDGKHSPSDARNKPVVGIRQSDAMAYAAWAGKQLPTRNQWMRAFRGDTDFLYPWGNEFRPELANFFENRAIRGLADVDATPRDKSAFGVYNLCGNASEILRDTVMRSGDRYALIKGAGGREPGFAQGMGPTTLYLELSSSHPGFGFRCVQEIQ